MSDLRLFCIYIILCHLYSCLTDDNNTLLPSPAVSRSVEGCEGGKEGEMPQKQEVTPWTVQQTQKRCGSESEQVTVECVWNGMKMVVERDIYLYLQIQKRYRHISKGRESSKHSHPSILLLFSSVNYPVFLPRLLSDSHSILPTQA